MVTEEIQEKENLSEEDIKIIYDSKFLINEKVV